MTILVTGSTGTVGAQVLTHLQGRGAEVRALADVGSAARAPSAPCLSGNPIVIRNEYLIA